MKEIIVTLSFSLLLADTMRTFKWPAGFVILSGLQLLHSEIMRLGDVKPSIGRHTSQFLLKLKQDTTAVTVTDGAHRLIPTPQWLWLRYTFSHKIKTLCRKIRFFSCGFYWNFSTVFPLARDNQLLFPLL